MPKASEDPFLSPSWIPPNPIYRFGQKPPEETGFTSLSDEAEIEASQRKEDRSPGPNENCQESSSTFAGLAPSRHKDNHAAMDKGFQIASRTKLSGHSQGIPRRPASTQNVRSQTSGEEADESSCKRTNQDTHCTSSCFAGAYNYSF